MDKTPGYFSILSDARDCAFPHAKAKRRTNCAAPAL